jgi:nucleoside-diphosphate-sugar epimerase
LKAFKVRKKIRYIDKRAREILHGFADVTLAKEALDFVPQYDAVSGFDDLVNEAKG